MRALFINAENSGVTSIQIKDKLIDIKEMLEGQVELVHRLPNGGRLYASKNANVPQAFSIGGSAPISGNGLIVGRRDRFGFFKSTSVDQASVEKITRFTTVMPSNGR